MDKKEQIITTAQELFAERGFENTPISLICERAGVSKGLVFHHFSSKNELLREIFARTTDIMVDINTSTPSPLRGKERLHELLKSFFAELATNKQLFHFNLNMMLQPSTRLILEDLIKQRASFLLRSTLAIFEDIDPEKAELLSYHFIAELDGIALSYFSIYEHYPLDKMKAHLIQKYS